MRIAFDNDGVALGQAVTGNEGAPGRAAAEDLVISGDAVCTVSGRPVKCRVSNVPTPSFEFAAPTASPGKKLMCAASETSLLRTFPLVSWITMRASS